MLLTDEWLQILKSVLTFLQQIRKAMACHWFLKLYGLAMLWIINDPEHVQEALHTIVTCYELID